MNPFRRLPVRAALASGLGVLLCFTAGGSFAAFAPAIAPRDWSFPRDHGAHPAFQTEWWYYTGHLTGDDGHRFGYELVFFRHALDPDGDVPPALRSWRPGELYPAHLAITDETGRVFFFRQRIERDFGGMAGADSSDLNVWCGGWKLERKGSAHELEAAADDWSLSLELVPLKDPVLNGEGGLSRKGRRPGQASYYYSLTRLATHGVVTFKKREWTVSGTSWMDHEFFTGELDTSLVGWDWFSLQFDDQSELMLYRLRGRAPGADRLSGTWVRPDGTARLLGPADFSVRSEATWKSPGTGIVYPSRWMVALPAAGLEVTISPTLADQELDARASTGVVYWEGSVSVTGRGSRGRLSGQGYVELTGYGSAVPGGRPVN